MNSTSKWIITVIVTFIVLYLLGTLVGSGDSKDEVYCKVFRTQSGIVAPYDDSCGDCGGSDTRCVCRVSGGCEQSGYGEICRGYCHEEYR